ncbi:MAG: DUF29 domain-containing protein [Leptolyngbyaceae cyanobacterium bins.302]|nr:DUF29 domain-containing protein [Leptolyngbyaceae cyanobacterium bins.302]
MTQTSTQKTLYDRDLNLWVEDTVAKLKARQFDQLDVDNLIDEVQALAGRDRRELESRFVVLFAHLLKRKYVIPPTDFRGWEITIRDQRGELRRLFKQSPSLKRYGLEVLDEVWQSALAEVQEDYPTIDLPDECPFLLDIESLLTEKFWEQE